MLSRSESKSESNGNVQTLSPLRWPATISMFASPGRLVNTPLILSVSEYTQAPVSVAKSIMRRGLVRAASASVSANTMRPSASV